MCETDPRDKYGKLHLNRDIKKTECKCEKLYTVKAGFFRIVVNSVYYVIQ